MPKNKVSDLITDQEIAFARLVLSGTMTDSGAAPAVGLNPDTAGYTKSKPCVRAYIIEHRAAVQQQLVEQETEGLRRLNLGPEITRGSITGQVKALSMIVAMQSLIPDRRAGSLEKKSAPLPSHPGIYAAAWLGEQERKTIDPQPGPALVEEEDEPNLAEPELAPGSAEDAPPPPDTPSPIFDPSGFANRPNSSEPTPSAPSAPDTRVSLSIKKNPFARRR
jgi:hypothetical protein